MISIYPFVTEKSNLSVPFKPYNLKRFSDLTAIVTKLNWSPGVYLNNHRKKDNFINATLIGLDFDGTMSLKEAVDNVFCDMRHIIGTTRNHQQMKGDEPPCDRFRVILQMPRPLASIDEYEYQLRIAFKRWDTDKNCVDAARYFKPCKEIISIADGYLWDIEQEPKELVELRRLKSELHQRQAKCYASLGKLSPKLEALLKKPNQQSGERNNTIFFIANDLFKHYGYSYEQVFETIKKSNTYINNENDRAFCRGVVATVKSAFEKHRGLR